MEYTTNYNLILQGRKPERVSLDSLNGNFTKIDALLKEQSEERKQHALDKDVHITSTEKTKWNTATEQSILNRQTLGYDCKNLLKNTATTQTINGITFTVNEDGSITASGTATDTASLYIYGTSYSTSGQKPIAKGNYVLSGCPSGGSDSTHRIRIGYRNESGTTNLFAIDYGEGANLDLGYDTIGCIVLQIFANQIVDNLTFKPMLRDARISDATYVPYQPSVEERLTVVEGKKTVLLYSGNPGVTTVTVDTGDYAYYKVFFTGEGGSYFMECDCVKGNNTIPISMLYNNVLNVGRINCVIDDTTVSISSMTGFAITADGNTASTLNFRLRKIYGVSI